MAEVLLALAADVLGAAVAALVIAVVRGAAQGLAELLSPGERSYG